MRPQATSEFVVNGGGYRGHRVQGQNFLFRISVDRFFSVVSRFPLPSYASYLVCLYNILFLGLCETICRAWLSQLPFAGNLSLIINSLD
jgi:hypothetical protein